MSLLQRTETLVERGEYKDALELLSQEGSLPEALHATKLFLQSHVSDLRKAQTAAESLLKRHAEPRTEAICREIIGRSLVVHGNRVADGLKLSERAREVAKAHLGLVAHARYSADHVATILHRVGINESSAQVQPLRKLVLASGDVRALIVTHLIQAEIRTKQTQLLRALADLQVVDDLLYRQPHLVLEGRRALAAATVETLDGILSEARPLAERALLYAERSGSVTLRIPALGTLAHILLLEGRLDECATRLSEAIRIARPGGATLIGLNDTRMQLMLARDELESVEAAASEVSELSGRFDSGYSYYGLWHLHTRVRWLLRIGKPRDAFAVAEDALPRIERMADRNLLVRMQLIAAEALGACGRPLDGAALLATALHQSDDPPLDIVAEAARVAGGLAADDPDAARSHYERAMRIFDALGHHTASAQTRRAAAMLPAAAAGSGSSPARTAESSGALTYLAKHPPLLGAEVLTLLRRVRACSNALLVEEDRTGIRRVLDGSHDRAAPLPRAISPYGTQIPLGTLGARDYELRVEACPSPSARSTLQAVERLVHSSVSLARLRQQERERAALWPEQSTEEQLGLIYASREMTNLVGITRRVAPSAATVLITGETGTGKEVFARALHQASGRHDGAFVPFNCTTVPRDMLDSQLFGYRRGSFTGAVQEYPGLIRAAEGGTLFLDEIGEMPIELQPKLLRFLESGEVLPLGETRPVVVNVRVVAATNADLDQLVNEGRFREDLYYRLNVVRLRVPPLRDRREEVPLLVRSLVERFARETQREPVRLSDEALEYLTLYHWPGNTRQLANELRRLLALTEPGALVMPEHLSPEIAASRRPRPARGAGEAELLVRTDQPLPAAVEHLERVLIMQAIDECDGNVERAAQRLGLSRKGLFLKRQRLGIG